MRLVVGACAALAVSATACAGDERLSAEEFRERSAELCRAADRKLDAAAAARSPDSEGAFWAEVEAVERELAAGFRELELPDDLRRALDAWLEAGGDVVELARLASAADVIAEVDARDDIQRRLVAATRAVEQAEDGLPLAPACTEET